MLSLADRTGRRTAGVAVRNALYLIPLGIIATSQGLISPAFAYESVAVSGMFALSASAFLSKPSQQVHMPNLPARALPPYLFRHRLFESRSSRNSITISAPGSIASISISASCPAS